MRVPLPLGGRTPNPVPQRKCAACSTFAQWSSQKAVLCWASSLLSAVNSIAPSICSRRMWACPACRFGEYMDEGVAQFDVGTPLNGTLDDFQVGLADHDALFDATLIEATGIGEFPTALIRARIALGLTQRELADRLGLAKQAIQRCEAGD